MYRRVKLKSFQNSKIKGIIKLREKRQRDRTQLFLVEGYREIVRAYEGRVAFSALFYSPDHFLGNHEEDLIAIIQQKGVEIFEVSKEVFKKISYRDRPDGLLAVARQIHLSLSDLQNRFTDHGMSFFLIAEGIEKPGNLGAILRSCDGAGVDALLICDQCTDIYNPNVIRASVGTLFTVPVFEVTSLEAIEWLNTHGIMIVASSPAGEELFTKADLTGKIAIAVGTEQWGLSKKWIKASCMQIKIPMHGIADSLNVATATTLLLYEVMRQKDSASH